MDYKPIKIGKIRNIDYTSGIGEIVTNKDSYMFRITEEMPTDLNPNDYVLFRAEQVQNQNVAFFIKRYTEENNQSLKAK
jgi:hypothetical protein